MFRALPFVTRCWFGATIVITLAANFEIISPMQILYIWPRIKNNFELWRIVTSFCYAGPFEFSTMISMYMMVQFSKQYEAGGPFNTGAGGGTADYAFMILFGMLTMLITYPIIPVMLPPVFCRNLIYYVLYVWSKRNPTSQANIWGFPLQAIYLPFAYLAMSVFMGNSYMDQLHGLAIGHIYYFMVDVIPQVYGKDVLKTPKFMVDYFGIGEYRPEVAAAMPRGAAVGQAAAARPAGGGGVGGYNWGGTGRPLGAN
jgi:Derlin-2/3